LPFGCNSNQQESLGSSLLDKAVVRHGVILTVQPSNEVHQLLLQDLDVVIGFAGGGGGGAGHRQDDSRKSGEGAANDHQQEVHGVGEGHGPSGRDSWHGGVVLLLRCWLICNSGGVVIAVFGEEVVQSLADELLHSAWFVGHRCAREPLLGCLGQQEKLNAGVDVPLVLNVGVRQEADPRVSHRFSVWPFLLWQQRRFDLICLKSFVEGFHFSNCVCTRQKKCVARLRQWTSSACLVDSLID
jgi:hypothetical protein